MDGLAFVSTSYVHQDAATKHKDWPDIEMHMVPADVVADGGRYFKQLAGLTDQVSFNLPPRPHLSSPELTSTW